MGTSRSEIARAELNYGKRSGLLAEFARPFPPELAARLLAIADGAPLTQAEADEICTRLATLDPVSDLGFRWWSTCLTCNKNILRIVHPAGQCPPPEAVDA